MVEHISNLFSVLRYLHQITKCYVSWGLPQVLCSIISTIRYSYPLMMKVYFLYFRFATTFNVWLIRFKKPDVSIICSISGSILWFGSTFRFKVSLFFTIITFEVSFIYRLSIQPSIRRSPISFIIFR